jgi:hypothetical protein
MNIGNPRRVIISEPEKQPAIAPPAEPQREPVTTPEPEKVPAGR